MTDPVHGLPPSRSAALGGVGVIFITGTFAIVVAAAVLVMFYLVFDFVLDRMHTVAHGASSPI